MRLLVLLAALAAAPVGAQTSPDMPSDAPDTLAVEDAHVLADSVVAMNRVEIPAPTLEPAPPLPPPSPTLHVFGRTGLRVTLPAGWDGPATADEGRLPRLAVYTFQNAASGPLAGVVLRAEQVIGLNALEQERWKRGQMPYGYHGARPTGPIATGLPALIAMETSRPGAGGAVAFLQRGQTYWALSVEAPVAVWAGRRAEVLALFAGIDLP